MCLALLGLMPVISNSRPGALDALDFALYLSLWQLVFAFPLVITELCMGRSGIVDAKLPSQKKRRTITVIMATGLIFGITTYLYVLSLEKAGTVSAAIAIQAYPLFAIFWETIFLNRRKTTVELVFTALLIAALYYLGTGGTWRIEGLSHWFLVALSVPFLWSIAHIIIKETLDNTPITPGQVAFFRVLVSSVALFAIAITMNGTESVLSGFSNRQFQSFALLMGLVYYVELVVWFHAVKHVAVSVASSITTPWPVITMILAAIFLNEEIAGYQILAMGGVAISIYGLLYAGKVKAQ